MIGGTAMEVAARHKEVSARHLEAASQILGKLETALATDDNSKMDELYRLATTHNALTSSLGKVIALEREMYAIDSAGTMTPTAYKQYTEDGILATAKLIERERTLKANGG